MSVLLKILEQDDKKIEQLRRRLGLKSKVAVVREGLQMLEQKIEREKKLQAYRRAARLAAVDEARREILGEFNSSRSDSDSD